MSEGCPQGNVKFEFMGHFFCQGEWKDGLIHWQRTVTLANGAYYEGEYSLDFTNKRNRKDIIFHAKGGVFKGNWKNEN